LASYKNIAQRVRIKIWYSMPRSFGGGVALSNKDERLIAEKIVKEYGGIKIYSQFDEDDISYDIFGVEDYVFFDRSLIRLERNSCLDFKNYDGVNHPDEIITKGATRLTGLTLMRIKLKCLNLPNEGMPFEYQG
jgi:hypothetical protein